LAYASAKEAFLSLIDRDGCFVSWRQSGVTSDRSGIENYFVEVTSESGVQYMIPAYGQEAIELEEAVRKVLPVPAILA
jgi:hypothetical protein